jgi:DNA-binding cell septation regulator SpoVG
MRLVSFKPLVKGALRGFANVELPNGLRIDDCPICVGGNGAWAALPSKPVLDREGKQVETDGKRQYAALLHWPDRETQDRWSDAVVALVRQAHSEALQ